MHPATRTLAATMVSGAAALAMTVTAAPALAHPGCHDPNHITLKQAKRQAHHELAQQLKLLDRFEGVVSDDPYLGGSVRHHALTAASKQQARDERAESRVADASTKQQVERAMRSACASGKFGDRDQHGTRDGHASLHQQKMAAELMLDGRKAMIQLARATHDKPAHPGYGKQLRQLDKTKRAVHRARTEQQLQRALHTGCGGHGGDPRR